jgi:futalosine hydrolase
MDDARFMYKAQFPPQVESMEGAAFMYAALLAGVPFAQVRAVSNRVERRNRDAWNLPLAIENLGRTTLAILDGE